MRQVAVTNLSCSDSRAASSCLVSYDAKNAHAIAHLRACSRSCDCYACGTAEALSNGTASTHFAVTGLHSTTVNS